MGSLEIAGRLASAITGERREDVLIALAAFARSCCKRWGVPLATFKDLIGGDDTPPEERD